MFPSLRHFMLISIAGMSLVLVSLLFFHVKLSDAYLQDHLSTHNRNLAIVLHNSLLSDGLETALRFSPHAFSEVERQRIEDRLKEELQWVPVVKVKVYGTDATVLFSTKQDEIGRDASGNQGVISALAGKSVSDLVRRDRENVLDGSVDTVDLHQQYIPIEDSDTGRILGVFEIYADVSKILEQVGARQQVVFWSIAGILGVFYAMLAMLFTRTHRSLQSERQQREAHLAELQKIRGELEIRVEQRTAELDKSKTFLQSIIDGIGTPLFVIRPDYTIPLMNKAARQLIPSGSDPDDFLHCYQVSHRRDEPCQGDDHPCS
ncbi:MAG: hypothetical protein QNJ91_17430, partial [Gammaproteobacteria bacterium]|nr:hypothetical protein [Gammaproteobacteria bacterium]